MRFKKSVIWIFPFLILFGLSWISGCRGKGEKATGVSGGGDTGLLPPSKGSGEIAQPAGGETPSEGAPSVSKAFRFEDAYGGSSRESASSIQQASDGGYIVAGYTDIEDTVGDDLLVMKLNSGGTIAWQKVFAGNIESNLPIQAIPTSDNGFLVAAGTFLLDSAGDVWILKLSSDGSLVWQKTFGGSQDDSVGSIQETKDGGYLMAGGTRSFGAGAHDFWVLKLDPNGSIVFQKTYGTENGDFAYSVQETGDGGYIVAGYNGAVGFEGSFNDVWVLKLDKDGNIAWQKKCGGSGYDSAYAVRQTSDGGYVLVGDSASFSEDATYDVWLLRLNSDGSIAWQKTFGSPTDDFASRSLELSDNALLIASNSDNDTQVSQINLDGSVIWQKVLSGVSANFIEQTADKGFVIAGETSSFGAGDIDLWVLKLIEKGIEKEGQEGTAVLKNTSVQSVDTSVSAQESSASVTDTSVTPIGAGMVVTKKSD